MRTVVTNVETDTQPEVDEDELHEVEEGRKKGAGWRNLSYAARVTISFSLIAAMTAQTQAIITALKPAATAAAAG